MTPEDREALLEQRKEDRKLRRRALLSKLWTGLCWVIAPLGALWLLFLIILLITQRLYTRTGEWVAVLILAAPALILLPLALITLRRALKRRREGMLS